MNQKYKDLLLIVFAIFLALSSFTNLMPITLNSGYGRSMQPLFTGLDLQVALNHSLLQTDLHRGDVVVTKDIDYFDNESSGYIKRIIGLPNDRVDIIKDRLYINGELINEPYLSKDFTNTTQRVRHFNLSDDEYLILGDNRNISNDSRYFGVIKNEDIEAVLLFHFNILHL